MEEKWEMNIAPSEKMKNFTTGIFTELANRKRDAMKQGMDVIDLSVGSPDLPPPSFVVDTLVQYAKDTTKYGYTLKGIPAFHEAVGYFYAHRYGVELDPDKEVLQLMGSQDGLAHLATALVNPGELYSFPISPPLLHIT
jgi:aspartate/methionine/tyrosine aminotransferase